MPDSCNPYSDIFITSTGNIVSVTVPESQTDDVIAKLHPHKVIHSVDRGVVNDWPNVSQRFSVIRLNPGANTQDIQSILDEMS